MFDNRGQIKIIEAFLAISVMFSVIVLTAPMSSTPDLEKQGTLKKLGTQVLIKLDNNGTLGKLIEGGNWTALKHSMDLFLPAGVFYNLTVYDENMQGVNTQEVNNSNQEGSEAVVIQYLCVTQSSDPHFYTITLQLAWPR
jgi:hypothetical protein